jgi:hypothetical protein
MECNEINIMKVSVLEFTTRPIDDITAKLICTKCETKGLFVRTFGSISSKVWKGKAEVVQEAKEEARKIAEKVRLGDVAAIREVYGEEN